MQHMGEYLKNLRIEKNITLEEAEDHTGIRVQYLQALEEGDFNKIPGDVFIKGFIRNYGNYLGADGNALVDAYIRSSETQAASAPAEPSPSDTIVIHHPQQPHQQPEQPAQEPERPEETPSGEAPAPDAAQLERPAEIPPVLIPAEKKKAEEEEEPEIKPFIKEIDDEELASLEESSGSGEKTGFFQKIRNFINENLYEDVNEKDAYEDDDSSGHPSYAYQKEEENGKKGLASYLNMKVFTIVFGVCLLIFCIVMAYFIFGGKTTPEIPATTSLSDSVKSENSSTRTAEKEEQPKEEAPKKEEKKEEPKGNSKTYGTETSGGVTVEITYKKPVWTQTSIDGKGVEAATVPKGSTRTYHGKNEVRISFGSIRDVSIKVNGKEAPLKSNEWGTMTKTFKAR